MKESIVSGLTQLPPIIDRQLFFGEVEIGDAQISPDGQYLSFLKPYNGTQNIWVKKTDDLFGAARRVSAETIRPISTYFWSRDSKYLLYLQDVGGDENFNVYAIDPALPTDSKPNAARTRALTKLQGVRTILFAAPKSKPDVLYIGLNDRDPRWHDLYELRLSRGEKRLIRKNTENITGWEFDNAGDLRLAVRRNQAGGTEILRVDPDGYKQIFSCTVLESCTLMGFDAINSQAYLITNRGSLDLAELELMDLGTGLTTKVESDPERRVDISVVQRSEVDHRILFTLYEDDRARWYFKDKEFEREYHWLKTRFPEREITLGSRSEDEDIWIMTVHCDTEPGETYIWKRKAKTLVLQYRTREQLPRPSLSERRPYRFKSSDGLDIPAFLTLPKGLPAKDLPLIVVPHRGPWERVVAGYDTLAQFLANRGYAVLEPNFRASSGYGKKFLNAGNQEWGRNMQDDLTWGVRALVAEGTVDPKRVGIFGGSYGGYATLAGVAFTPTVYAAAVAYVAPSNLITLLDAIPPYWEGRREEFYTRIGDPRTSEGKTLLMAQSPLTHAKAIVTPLLVVQGRNDPIVNIRESNQIVAAVRDNGIPVEYLVAPDEGHLFARPINNLAMVAAMERFFAKHLHGRHQVDISPDVEAKLREISVDPKTVSGDVLLNGKS